MSVKVEQLTKVYGTQRAVDDISFEVGRGEILGFLGPNGAGKSTTMKILTCFIPQTSGKATVCGYEVGEAPLEVRQRVGYLPELNPLYEGMYVREYLHFVAGLHKIPGKARRIADMVERTGLGVEQHKLIGTLSKGYRQRVGLAQAMLHDPEVLILDEPTSGLDPNQLVEIRGLIRQLGQEKTVIFSTHIMQEVQALSDRVVIINRGRLVADGTIGQLQRRVREEMVVTLTFAEPVQDSLWRRLPQVREWRHLGGSRWRVTGVSGEDIRGVLFRFAVSQELTLLELRQEESSVEDVFQQLTGKGARAIV
ncbi:MAG: hypothetical protein RLY31_1512 [Bacteroidota bacterium]